MKIYTRTGDNGTTGLFGGQRVHKSDARINCYGTVDELNATVGVAVSAAATGKSAAATAAMAAAYDEWIGRLHRVQNELFVIGSYLATPNPSAKSSVLPPLDDSMVSRLESEIDAAEADLPPLKSFILPGGCEAAARLHVSRTVCRRAERLLVTFEEHAAPLPGIAPADALPPAVILIYLNRLSDWLFVQARWINHTQGVADIKWRK